MILPVPEWRTIDRMVTVVPFSLPQTMARELAR